MLLSLLASTNQHFEELSGFLPLLVETYDCSDGVTSALDPLLHNPLVNLFHNSLGQPDLNLSHETTTVNNTVYKTLKPCSPHSTRNKSNLQLYYGCGQPKNLHLAYSISALRSFEC